MPTPYFSNSSQNLTKYLALSIKQADWATMAAMPV